tara:strand:- start:816 stop:2243 length:1428 start_codon:yes stop_codon:yes gene_type:complete
MKISSGTVDQYIYFVAVDSTDLKTRETGLTTFTVYRSRNGAAAAVMTTPTVNETDATNMPGVYELLLDEDMTIGASNDDEEMAFHITQAAMAPVTRTINLYRSKITGGNTLDVTATGAAGIDWGNVENKTTANDLSGTDIQLVDTVTTYTGNTLQTIDAATLNDVAATDIVSNGAITTLTGSVVSVDLCDLTTLTTTTTTNTDMVTEPPTVTQMWDTDISALVTANGGALLLKDVPSTIEFNNRTILSTDYFDPAIDAVANVTLVATTTTNTDMRGTDSAALATSLATVDTNVDTLITNQGDWATAVGFATPTNITAATGIVLSGVTHTGAVIPTVTLTDTVTTYTGNTKQTADNDVRLAANNTLLLDIPTVSEFEARTPTAAELAYIVGNAALGVPVTFASGTTTTGVFTASTGVDGTTPDATDDHYNGRLLVFTDGTLINQVTDITDYVGSTRTVTITAITSAVGASTTARLI